MNAIFCDSSELRPLVRALRIAQTEGVPGERLRAGELHGSTLLDEHGQLKAEEPKNASQSPHSMNPPPSIMVGRYHRPDRSLLPTAQTTAPRQKHRSPSIAGRDNMA